MSLIIPIRGFTPKFGNNCFLAPNATIVGDVITGNNCSIWFNAVVRGDVHYIRIGNNVNIQDCAVIHGTYQKSPVDIGNNVAIAHNAIVHGCTIKDNVLIGMGAIIMDNAVIESNTIIAAGSVVLENSILEPENIYAGSPAKKIKKISIDLIRGQIERITNSYIKYASWYKDSGNPLFNVQ